MSIWFSFSSLNKTNEKTKLYNRHRVFTARDLLFVCTNVHAVREMYSLFSLAFLLFYPNNIAQLYAHTLISEDAVNPLI